MDGTGELFGPLLDALGEQLAVDVVRYPSTEAMGYEDLVQLVEAQLPVGKPYVLLAESFSGPVALKIAATSPPQLVGLILCATFARNPRPALRFLPAQLMRLPFKLSPMNWVIGPLGHALLGQFSTEQLVGLLRAALAQVAPDVVVRRLREVQRVDVVNDASQIKVPAMYLLATKDKVVPRRASQIIHRAMSQLRIVSINAPHCLLQAAPLDAAKSILTFIDSLRLEAA
jgi:pimeloyl-ACP methyl ester carboxylesterase